MQNFRTVVFKRAYDLHANGMTWSDALREAWRRYRRHRDFYVANISWGIRKFDVYCHYSDDPKMRKRGEQQEQRIREDLERFPWLKNKVLNGITDPERKRRFSK